MSFEKMSSCDVPAYLVLEDGQVFDGIAAGADGVAVGLLSVQTSMTGYERLLRDTDNEGKLLLFTAPHIGNCGRVENTVESTSICASGLIVRELSRRTSNLFAVQSVADWLLEQQTVAICEVDTRAVVRYLREHGALRGAIVHGQSGDDRSGCIEVARKALGLSGKPST